MYGRVQTSVVDEGVDVSVARLDLLESLLDRLVTGEINCQRLNGVGRLWTFFLKIFNREICLV